VEPYVVGWFTPGFPNDAELELYARAENPSGNRQRGSHRDG
jgi:hypothetical protein